MIYGISKYSTSFVCFVVDTSIVYKQRPEFYWIDLYRTNSDGLNSEFMEFIEDRPN